MWNPIARFTMKLDALLLSAQKSLIDYMQAAVMNYAVSGHCCYKSLILYYCYDCKLLYTGKTVSAIFADRYSANSEVQKPSVSDLHNKISVIG